MKVTAHGSGGFSGQAAHFELDTAKLANGKEIEALLQNLDFLPAPPQPVGADIERWHLTIDDDGAQRTLAFANDGSAQAAPWQALVEGLRAAA